MKKNEEFLRKRYIYPNCFVYLSAYHIICCKRFIVMVFFINLLKINIIRL